MLTTRICLPKGCLITGLTVELDFDHPSKSRLKTILRCYIQLIFKLFKVPLAQWDKRVKFIFQSRGVRIPPARLFCALSNANLSLDSGGIKWIVTSGGDSVGEVHSVS